MQPFDEVDLHATPVESLDFARNHCFEYSGWKEDTSQGREEENDWVNGGEPDSVESMYIRLRHSGDRWN